jgi:hypothetical protein
MVRHDRLPKVTRRSPPKMTVIALVLVTGGATPHAQGNSAWESLVPAETSGRGGIAAAGAPASNLRPSRAISPGDWPRLHLPDPVGRYIAGKALDLAWERLAEINCAEVLNAFRDRAGRPLAERLRQLAVDRQTYLTMLVFIDGSREAPCMMGSFAFTTPGSRVVRICVEELKRTWQKKPEYAVSRLIHEMLHTLGLGEDPPTSAEITRRVSAACRPRR